jgi:predicted O-methyltransferase YrrM
LDYLKAAEQLLSPGSIIVADNAGNVCEISWRTRYSQVIQV